MPIRFKWLLRGICWGGAALKDAEDDNAVPRSAGTPSKRNSVPSTSRRPETRPKAPTSVPLVPRSTKTPTNRLDTSASARGPQSTPTSPQTTSATLKAGPWKGPIPTRRPPASAAPKTRSAPAPTPVANDPRRVKKFDIETWEHDTVGCVLKVTLDRSVSERTGYDTVWLKELSEELELEERKNVRLNADLAGRLLISRLKLDRSLTSDDMKSLPLAAPLLAKETTFEYLVGAWKRVNETKATLIKKKYSPLDTQTASERLEKLRGLIVSYIDFTLQEPKIFPQPFGRPLGPPELITCLLSLRPPANPYQLTPSKLSPNPLTSSELEQLLQELADRFEANERINGVLGPVIKGLLFHESLFHPEGLINHAAHWRGVVMGLEVLVSVKRIAMMITQMKEWNPLNATAATFEKVSLLGPVCRLGMFPQEWPAISESYFSSPDKRTRTNLELSFITLRGTLKTLQYSLFQIFNKIVRASPEAREAALQYFYRVISLNSKRAGTHVEPHTVASDSFMVNLQNVLFRLAEPFMDAGYTKIARIDPSFYALSSRIDLKNETHINATQEETVRWENVHGHLLAPEANFVTNIFHITVAMSHYGYLKTLHNYRNL